MNECFSSWTLFLDAYKLLPLYKQHCIYAIVLIEEVPKSETIFESVEMNCSANSSSPINSK